MAPRVLLASVAFLTAFATAVLPACVACNDIACEGGFIWSANTNDDLPLPPGEYQIRVQAEDSTLRYTCDVNANYEDSLCAGPWLIDGEDVFTVRVGLEQAGAGSLDPEGPVTGFEVIVVDESESSTDGNYVALRGPEEIDILLEFKSEALANHDYAPNYVRSDAFFGDPRCGYCDERESRSVGFDPPVVD
jgi:hypothetical protein